MSSFDLGSGNPKLNIHGALDFDERPEGLGPRRLPSWTRSQVPQGMDVMLRMPSGVRIQFDTDAVEIGLDVHVTRLNQVRQPTFNFESGTLLLSATAEHGNRLQPDPTAANGFRIERGDKETVWFKELPQGRKFCEIWLPHNQFLALQKLRINDGAQLYDVVDSRKKWVHYGSSISHCMEALEPAFTWPAVAARHAGVSVQNLGFGGQCHLDQFVARTIRDLEADVISIKCGINIINLDSMRERVFAPALHGFLDTIRDGHVETPIVLCSPIYCPSAEERPGPTIPDDKGKFVTFDGLEALRHGCLSLTRVRAIMRELVEARVNSGDDNLHYFDGLELFGEADADDLPDDLHPNPAGYVRMGERFAKHGLPLALT